MAVIVSLLLVSGNGLAFPDTGQPTGTEAKQENGELLRRLETVEAGLAPLYLAGSYGLRTLIHESGHVLFARISGASRAEISEYHFFWGKASYAWDINPAPWQKLLASGGGLILTRITAETTDYLLDRGMVPNWLGKLAGGYYLCARFDVPNYVLKSSFDRFILDRTAPGDDVFSISSTISELFLPEVGIPEKRQRKKRRIINGLYLTWLIASGIDLYLDFAEIEKNINRTLGREVGHSVENDSGFEVYLHPRKLEFSYQW